MNPSRSDYTVNVTMTGGHARLLIQALDLVVSVGLGRMEDVARAVTIYHRHADLNDNEELNRLFGRVKEMVGLNNLSNWGIGHPNNVQSVREAYDLMKALRKLVATAEGFVHEGGTWSDGVFVKYGQLPVPTATYTRDGTTTPVPLGDPRHVDVGA